MQKQIGQSYSGWKPENLFRASSSVVIVTDDPDLKPNTIHRDQHALERCIFQRTESHKLSNEENNAFKARFSSQMQP